MLQSKLFTKTTKETPKDEVSINASLLVRAGFIDKLSAGVYSFLPLGLRVLDNIKKIIREEMNAIGGQEILMPALISKEYWTKTKRWNAIDVLFKIKGVGGKEYGLGSTHEEVVTPLIKKFVHSYKDLPLAIYQIQDKFRDEPRAKSGLLRGREFSMKDLYSFHANKKDLEKYYEQASTAYSRIFERCGLNALIVEATGGVFSKYSHEFQVITQHGEDIIYICHSCGKNQNKELITNKNCPDCGKKREEQKSIEVGNIFKLGTRFSNAFDFSYIDEQGKKQPIIMGCYGIGPSRVMGAIVEVHHDKKGIVWPNSVAPFAVHLLEIGNTKKVSQNAEGWHSKLEKKGIPVLYDNRNLRAGEKFAESDLIGIPYRLVISEKTGEGAELKQRASSQIEIVKFEEAVKRLTNAK